MDFPVNHNIHCIVEHSCNLIIDCSKVGLCIRLSVLITICSQSVLPFTDILWRNLIDRDFSEYWQDLFIYHIPFADNGGFFQTVSHILKI